MLESQCSELSPMTSDLCESFIVGSKGNMANNVLPFQMQMPSQQQSKNVFKGQNRNKGETILGNLQSLIKLTKKTGSKTIRVVTTAHFPTELNQCRKFHQSNGICFLKPESVYKKTSLTIKSNNSGFWSYSMSKLRNFGTRFQARDTWPRVL